MDSFAVSALQDASGYAISRQNILVLHLLIKLFYIGMPVVKTDGHSYPWCSAGALRARELRYEATYEVKLRRMLALLFKIVKHLFLKVFKSANCF